MYDVASFLITHIHNDSVIARKMGVSRQTIARWKEDPDKIPTGMLKKLVSLFGYRVKIDRLERSYEL